MIYLNLKSKEHFLNNTSQDGCGLSCSLPTSLQRIDTSFDLIFTRHRLKSSIALAANCRLARSASGDQIEEARNRESTLTLTLAAPRPPQYNRTWYATISSVTNFKDYCSFRCGLRAFQILIIRPVEFFFFFLSSLPSQDVREVYSTPQMPVIWPPEAKSPGPLPDLAAESVRLSTNGKQIVQSI